MSRKNGAMSRARVFGALTVLVNPKRDLLKVGLSKNEELILLVLVEQNVNAHQIRIKKTRLASI
jgi:hypothetical protein